MVRGIGVTALVALGLAVYAAIDCARTPTNHVLRLRRAVWLLAIVLVPVAGPVSWLVLGRVRPSRGGRPAPRPVSPDDDPDFLSSLNDERIDRARREQQAREQQRREQQRRPDGDPGPEDPPQA